MNPFAAFGYAGGQESGLFVVSAPSKHWTIDFEKIFVVDFEEIQMMGFHLQNWNAVFSLL